MQKAILDIVEHFKAKRKSVSLNAIVDVRRRHHEMIFFISRKLLELATSKFTTGSHRESTFPPEMTS